MARKWQELSVLVAGCGSIGKRHARILSELQVENILVCDPIAASREELASQVPCVRAYESYEAGLAEKPNAVLICTPPKLHVPMAIQAIEAGCHVLC